MGSLISAMHNIFLRVEDTRFAHEAYLATAAMASSTCRPAKASSESELPNLLETLGDVAGKIREEVGRTERQLLAVAANTKLESARDKLEMLSSKNDMLAAEYTELRRMLEKDAGTPKSYEHSASTLAKALSCNNSFQQPDSTDLRAAVSEALVLYCLCTAGFRSRVAFELALEMAFGETPPPDNIKSQSHKAYAHLMQDVSGHFTTNRQRKKKNRRWKKELLEPIAE